MTSTQYCLSSKIHKSQVFEGFSRLQRDEEFTDMTLVAEGCLVKVHRTLMALSSPLLKELLRSVPCKHPVLFLNDITHNILCFILEYVYTGEVNIPNEHIQPFFKAAKSMNITGLENIVIPQTKDATLEEDKTKHMIHNARPSSAANKPIVIINDVQKVQLPIVNGRGKIFPAYSCGVPSVSSTATDNIKNNKIENDLMIQQTNESNTLPIGSSVLVGSDKIGQYLNFINVKTEPDTDINLHDNEDFNNIQDVRVIKNENIHILPMIIEGDQGYSNNHNLVNQPNENADGASQVDLSSLMNISSTSLVQSHDMAAVDISINDLVEIKLLDTLNTITATETVANKNKAVKMMKCDHEQRQMGKDILEESDVNMASTADLHEDDSEEDEIDSENAGSAPSSGYVTKEQMDEVLRKDSDSMIYMVSYRGSLQLIMDHYIYNCQYSRNTKNMRRWRCADYKRLKCLAMVDTQNGVIVNRKHKHSHPNHDEKIYIKVMKRQCFPTIEMAQESVKRKNPTSEPYVVDTINLEEL